MRKMIKTFLQLVWLFLVTNIFGDEYKLNFEGKIYLNDLNIPAPSFEKANRLDSREKDSFLIIGHAGSPYKKPENTIEGFEQALKDGANGLEMDLCISKDNVIFLWHDWDPNSTIAQARAIGLEGFKYKPYFKIYKKVNELSFEEIKKYYGYILNKVISCEFYNQIPSFEDFAKWASDKNQIRIIYLDIKIPPEMEFYTDFFVREIYRISKNYGILDKIVFFSPHENIVRRAKEYVIKYNLPLQIGLDKEISPSLILTSKEKNIIYEAIDIKKEFFVLNKAHQMGLEYAAIGRPTQATIVGGWQNYLKVVSYNVQMKKLMRLGVKLILWTIDKQDEVNYLFRLGVDGIITNQPDKVSMILRNYH
jgi:glycerophosphoryl diester phosphodiesterase